METCAPTIAKYLLFVFNLIFSLSGLALVIAGALTAKMENPADNQTDLTGPAVLFIVLGCLIFVVAFFGCCGAIKENRCMLLTFAAILGVILVMELAGGIAGAVGHKQINHALRTSLNTSLHRYYNSSEDRKTWDDMQRNYECCGIEGPSEWGKQLPESCCPPPKTEAACSQPYPQGCHDKARSALRSAFSTIAGLGIGLAFLEIIGIFMACCLAIAIKKEQEAK